MLLFCRMDTRQKNENVERFVLSTLSSPTQRRGCAAVGAPTSAEPGAGSQGSSAGPRSQAQHHPYWHWQLAVSYRVTKERGINLSFLLSTISPTNQLASESSNIHHYNLLCFTPSPHSLFLYLPG